MAYIEAIDVSKPCVEAGGKSSKSGHCRKSYKNRVYYAHRLAWFLAYGEWPRGDLHHICENKRCINLSHLKPMTRSEHLKRHYAENVGFNNSLKETCKFGHPFDYHNGIQRVCLRCKHKAANAYTLRKRLELQNVVY